MKIIFTILLFLFSINYSLAQNKFFQEKFHQLYFQGIGLELDYNLFPTNAVEIENETYFNQWESGGIKLSLSARLNLLELGDDQAISISTEPYLGLNFGMNLQRDQNYRLFRDALGIGSVGLPILLNYHIGKNATNRSTSKFGFNFSLGKEYILNPIFTWQESPMSIIGLKRYHEGFVLKFGITREKKRLHEFFIRTIIFRNNRTYYFDPLSSFYYATPSHGPNFSLGITFYQKK